MSSWLAALAVLSSVPVGYSQAAVLYDTTGGSGTSSTGVIVSGNSPLANSFQVASSSILASTTLDLVGSDDSSKFRVNLAASTLLNGNYYPNLIGMTLLGTVVDNTLPTSGGGAPVTFTPSAPIPLAANTRYWIVVNGPTTGAWVAESNFVWTGTVNVAAEYNVASGATNLNSTLFTPFQMLLSSSVPQPVPEASSLSLMLAALVAGSVCVGVAKMRRT